MNMASSVKKSAASSPPKDALPTKPQASNGVITDNPAAPGGPAINKKKQKRRQKERARQAAAQDQPTTEDYAHANGHAAGGTDPNPDLHYGAPDYASDAVDPDEYTFSDEDEPYPYEPDSLHHGGTARNMFHPPTRKGKYSDPYIAGYSRGGSYPRSYGQHPPPLPPLPGEGLREVQRSLDKSSIWDTSGPEERQRIKEFWMGLGEKERRALVNVEKKDVLQKMKEQQKHSCSCSVCGRKRTAIEEELESLYNAYYTELENCAKKSGNALPASGRFSQPMSRTASNQQKPYSQPPKESRGRKREPSTNEHKTADAESLSEDDYDDDYSGDDSTDLHHRHANDFFTFGNSLTVKGNILTVADDLLRNDGQKFIDMMEQLAERRMQREEETREAAFPGHYGSHAGHSHQSPHDDDDEDDDEEEEEEELYDDEDDYDSEEDDYENEEEMDTLTDEQRMEEGKRMFQIFAARLFEQRVLNAYRVKVSDERARLLIEEEEAGKNAETQQKNSRDAEKKKQKRLKQKQKLAEQKAAKEEAEAVVRAKKDAEEQEKKEKERQKREENRKKQEVERQRKAQKDAEERERKAEAARKKAAEVERRKTEERQRREEALKKAKEEREAKEEETRAKRAQEEQAHLTKDGRTRSGQDTSEQPKTDPVEESGKSAAQQESTKKAPPTMVALPPTLVSRTSNTVLDSPVSKVATPVLPKAPTPSRPRETSRAVSQTSHTPEQASNSKHSTPPRSQTSQASTPMTTLPQLRSPTQAPLPAQPPQISPVRQLGYQSASFQGPHVQGGSGSGFNAGGYQNSMFPPPSSTRLQFNPQMQPFQSQVHQASGFQRPLGTSTIGPPPGMQQFAGTQHTQAPFQRQYQAETQPITSTMPNSIHHQQSGVTLPGQHARQSSVSQETTIHPPSIGQPISRPAPPAPIKRPASTKPGDVSQDMRKGDFQVEELSRHLGSSALLGDDEPLPDENDLSRRPSGQPGMAPPSARPGIVGSPFDNGPPTFSGLGMRGTQGDPWGTPGLGAPPGWGKAPVQSSGWGSSALHPPIPRQVNARSIAVRSMMCQACRQSPGIDGGYHEFSDIVRYTVDATRQLHLEPPVSFHELRLLLDTPGDGQNGGGSFNVKNLAAGRILMKWEPDNYDLLPGESFPRGLGIGEIGSPVHASALPGLGGLGGGTRGF